jgi:methionyl-tRNA formyltransferase
VKQLALEWEIPVYQPATLKDREEQAKLAGLNADLMIVAAYGLLLPQQVLDAPRLGCINIHASLLPRWRGAAPIQRAILAGDRESGVTIMTMEAGLDTGPMLHKIACPIEPMETGGTLHDRLAELGAQALMEVLPNLEEALREAEIQDEALANYAKKLDKQESLIDWNQPALEIARKVRAFNPWPVAETRFQGKTMRIWMGEVIGNGAAGQAGKVLSSGKQGIDVATGDGVLRILKLQMPGKRAMAAADFLNAHQVDGIVLG